MSLKSTLARERFRKKKKQGFRGFPVATVTYYGPTDHHASKVAVGLIPYEGAKATALERFFSGPLDARRDDAITDAIIEFVKAHSAKSVVTPDRILGCPHEEGIDYPEGESCPKCPFWAGRNRFTGELK